jgi:hypothetical protein
MFVAAPYSLKEATCQRTKLFRYVNMTHIVRSQNQNDECIGIIVSSRVMLCYVYCSLGLLRMLATH